MQLRYGALAIMPIWSIEMNIKEKHIECTCGKHIDTSDNTPQVVCTQCKRVYAKQPSKLLFMGVQEETFLPGIVII